MYILKYVLALGWMKLSMTQENQPYIGCKKYEGVCM